MSATRFFSIAAIMTSAVIAFAGNSKGKATPWKISGQLLEHCSCNAACPCWFGSMPTRMQCSGDQVLFIKSGMYGSTPLDGLAMAQFVRSPEGKTMLESVGSWEFDTVYIDSKASPEQRKALEEIAKHAFVPGTKTRTVKYAPIEQRMQGKEYLVTVGSVSSASGHLMEGGYGGAPVIKNALIADPTHKSFKQGISTKLTYNDDGRTWDFQGTNFMFAEFKVDNVEYEKFEAEMAKKMSKMGAGGGKP